MKEVEIEIYSSINKIVQHYDIVYANKVCTLIKTKKTKNSYLVLKGELPEKGVLRFEEIPREIKLFEGVIYYPTIYFDYSLNESDNPKGSGSNIVTISKNSNIKFTELYDLLQGELHNYTFKII